MIAAARFRVTGHVQGVFFRAAAQQVATRLGLRGHAINRADGSVEVLAMGNPRELETLADWLREGSSAARVEHVERESIDPVPDLPEAFTTG